jgi:hypothetical protein
VLETLRGEGCPPPACRAVVAAALCYVDAELLNALMLRRDTCSISAVKALQARAGAAAPPGPLQAWWWTAAQVRWVRPACAAKSAAHAAGLLHVRPCAAAVPAGAPVAG